ncbi:MAG: DUF1772 domain-containing protein [Proteobacteria bacterium]|nr:DUF1772 domain-containing protein [Pseudomonadota bacterium]
MFMALLATGLALGAALAHVLELPNKIGLAREPYFVVQQVYNGWWQLAYLLAVELVSIVAVIWTGRHRATVFRLGLLALGGLIAAQAIFWVWTFPANAATANWTEAPSNWKALKLQWEYSHAAGAACQLLVFVALILAVLSGPTRKLG